MLLTGHKTDFNAIKKKLLLLIASGAAIGFNWILLFEAYNATGIPVATVGVNASLNAAILAVEMLSLADAELADRLACYKSNLCKKIEKANEELKELKYEYKTN